MIKYSLTDKESSTEMILPILNWPHTSLMTRCTEWDFNDPPFVVDFLIADMTETMIKSNGIGLAANQVGVLYRIMIIHVQETDEFIAMFNPEVVSQDELRYVAMEGCLSFPGVFLDISRPKTVEVKWQTRMGELKTGVFNEIDAKCILHEIEHLDGRVFKDHVSGLKYDMALKKAKKLI
jgi:peptide deformylase